MASNLPRLASRTFSRRKPLFWAETTPGTARKGPTVVLDSGNSDSDGGHTPTYEFRAGNVVVLRTSTGRYVEANDTNGDRNTAASIETSSFSTTSGGDVVLSYKGGQTISVTNSTGSGTVDNYVTDLNADATFASLFVADNNGGELRIRTRGRGADEWFYVAAGTHDDLGFSEGEANAVYGTDADYLVTAEWSELQDEHGTAIHNTAATYEAAVFDESELINLTAEARAVLSRRGSTFR